MKGEWYQVRWIEAYNDSGQTINPFELVIVTSAAVEGPGRTVLTVDGPARDNDYPLAINSHKPIPDQGYGLVTLEGPAFVKYDNTDTPAIGEEWGASTAVYMASKDFAGLLVLADPDEERDLVLVEVARPGRYRPKIFFTLNEELTTADADATATIDEEWGFGYPSPYTGAGEIVVKNMPNSSTGYSFEGDIGACGVATHSHGNVYIIDNIECP